MMHCINCKYCFELRELVDGEWHKGFVCTYFPMTEEINQLHNFALVVSKDDMCEEFVSRKR